MAENTAIEWTDSTFNPWWGCTRVSPACDHCYAEALSRRTGSVAWGHNEARRRTSPKNWNEPRRWNKVAAEAGKRHRVFSLSMGDWADTEVPHEWRRDLFDLIAETPNLDWLLLTKRHALAKRFLPASPWPNITVGMTVENQEMASVRLRGLAEVAAAGWRTFVSYEPALGPVDWGPHLRCIGWLIAGGESGPGARPMHPDWARAARDAAVAAGVPFLFKQWGDWGCIHESRPGDVGQMVNGFPMVRVGKKRAGRTLDGRTWDELPDHLR